MGDWADVPARAKEDANLTFPIARCDNETKGGSRPGRPLGSVQRRP